MHPNESVIPTVPSIMHPKSDAVKPMPPNAATKPFELKSNVGENVAELRRVLGSVKRPLSRDDFAELLNQRDPARARAYATIERWENSGVEPDYQSARIMADLAGVTFEEFALGVKKSRARGTPVDERGEAAAPTRRRRGA